MNIWFCSPEVFNRNKPPEYKPVSFELTDPSAFQQWRKTVIANTGEKAFPWNIQSIYKTSDMATGPAYVCLAGGLTHPSSTIRFHLWPHIENIAGFDTIKQKIKSLIAPDNNHNGLILGGVRTKHTKAVEDDDEKNSMPFFRELLRFFKQDLKLNRISYFVGQPNRDYGVDAYYRSKDDTWYLTVRDDKGRILPINREEDLAKHFKWKQVHPDHSVKINGSGT